MSDSTIASLLLEIENLNKALEQSNRARYLEAQGRSYRELADDELETGHADWDNAYIPGCGE